MKIVAISGKAGAGKDTFAQMFGEAVKAYGCFTVRRGFADALKEEVAAFITQADELDVCLFLQKKGCQEDEAYAICDAMYQRFNGRFAPWFRRSYIGKDRILAMLHGSDRPEKRRFRALLQWWGTEYRRKEQTNYWLNALQLWIDALPDLKRQIVTVPDLRFPNELAMLKTMNAIAVRVEREDFAIDPRHRGHVSETALDGAKLDVYVRCKTGELDKMKAIACGLAEHLCS